MALPQTYVSVSRRPPDIEDYIDMLRRYRSWIIGPVFGGLVVATVVAFLWPDTFESEAVMRITPQQVSEKLVPDEFSARMAERLNEMEQQIESRSSLEALITTPSLDLYKRERTSASGKPMEDIVQDMRKDIKIEMLLPTATSSAAGGASAPAMSPADARSLMSAFSIKFSYSDRFKAQAVVRSLVGKFIEQNVDVQKNQAKLTADFLDDELRTAKGRLEDLENQITKFRVENQGKLPEEFQANQAMLNSLQIELGNVDAGLQRANDTRSSLETQLKNLMTQKEYVENNSDDIVSTPGQVSVQNQQLINTDQALTASEMRLRGLQRIYGENYPEVVSLKGEIEMLKARKDELQKEQDKKDAETSKPGVVKVKNTAAQTAIVNTNAQIEATKTSITEARDDIQRLTRLQAELNRRVAAYQQRIEAAPLNEKQYSALNRDYVLAKEQYDLMMKRRGAAETSQNLEEHKAGENLEQLDPPSLPEQPKEPKRPIWAGIGTAVGLLIGLMLAGAKEMKNTSLKNLKDVRAYTNLPVLSSIPLLENALLVRRKRRLTWLAWSGAFIAGAIAMAAAMYYYYAGGHTS